MESLVRRSSCSIRSSVDELVRPNTQVQRDTGLVHVKLKTCPDVLLYSSLIISKLFPLPGLMQKRSDDLAALSYDHLDYSSILSLLKRFSDLRYYVPLGNSVVGLHTTNPYFAAFRRQQEVVPRHRRVRGPNL